MDILSNITSLTIALIGIIFLFSGFLFQKFPPKKINRLYGYRTKNSMANNERWNYAQNYSATQLVIHSIVLIFLAVVLFVIPVKVNFTGFDGILIAVVVSISLIVRVEARLNKKFGKLD